MAQITLASALNKISVLDKKINKLIQNTKFFQARKGAEPHPSGKSWEELNKEVSSNYQRIKDLDKRVGLCVDIGHVVRYGKDPVHAVKTCADRVLDVHLKDVTKATAKGTACPGGRGVIDLPAVLNALIEVGFNGVASFEYEQNADDPLPGLAESVGYIRGILAMV